MAMGPTRLAEGNEGEKAGWVTQDCPVAECCWRSGMFRKCCLHPSTSRRLSGSNSEFRTDARLTCFEDIATLRGPRLEAVLVCGSTPGSIKDGALCILAVRWRLQPLVLGNSAGAGD